MRALIYIRGTLNLPLILRANILSVIKWWVDASFSAHPDYKGHTGAMMSMGSGSTMYIPRKKKINGRISTDAEIVGEDNALPQCLWYIQFIEGQGYAVEELDFHQDNMSDILMEKIG